MMPVAAYIDSINFLSQKIFILYITTAVVIVFIRSLFINKQEEIAGLSTKISSTVLIIIYPGLFLSFFVFITGFNHASIALCFLCLLVIINDILAFFIGKLAGKKLNYIVSPNKSMAGYLAGITGSICVSLAFYYLFPDIFRINIIFMILFGAFIGITTIAGDLIESALKRAVGVKDSGTLMIGRGGILDSIDSLLLCAPVFYFIYPLIIQS
jgi:phosphatidate cytidylyltransferase